jgi:hypothetical protein
MHPFYQEFIQNLQNYFQKIRKSFHEFSSSSPTTLQNIQLTFIYFFALVDLLHSILTNVFALEYFPEIILPFLPVIKGIIFSPFFQIWASPEKVFLLSYLVIEVMIVRSIFEFSKLVKYNILLIFALLMLQSLAISYWDILFHREVAAGVSKWAVDQGAVIYTDKDLAIAFFFNTFMLFIVIYLYCYIRGLQGKFATLPLMEWLTDSIAFWLRVKTPTMRVGKRKKTNNPTIQEQEKREDEDDDVDDDVDDDDDVEEIEEIDFFEYLQQQNDEETDEKNDQKGE